MGRDTSMRLSAFVDAGNVWGYDQVQLRQPALQWWRGAFVEFADGAAEVFLRQSVQQEADDKVQRLQFQMGSVF
jgi:outer membrane protein insertion porin family